MGFLGGASGKESTCQCRRHKTHGFDPWVEKIPGAESGNPLPYSCLENSMDSGAWWDTVRGVTKSWMWLSTHTQGICPVVGLLGHIVVLFLVFKEVSVLSSIVAVSIFIPTNCAWGFPLLTSSPAFFVYRFLMMVAILTSVRWLPSCSFNLHFSNNEQCWAFFHVCTSHLLWRNVCLGLLSIVLNGLFFWYWAAWAACIFWTNPLSVASFAVIFSHSEGCFSPCF